MTFLNSGTQVKPLKNYLQISTENDARAYKRTWWVKYDESFVFRDVTVFFFSFIVRR